MRKKKLKKDLGFKLQPTSIIILDLKTTNSSDLELIRNFLKSNNKYVFSWKDGRAIGVFKIIDRINPEIIIRGY